MAGSWVTTIFQVRTSLGPIVPKAMRGHCDVAHDGMRANPSNNFVIFEQGTLNCVAGTGFIGRDFYTVRLNR